MLQTHCGYSITEKPDVKWEKTACSFVAQTATHALVFTNEKIVAKTDIGPVPIRKRNQAPACLFINKLSVKELKVGNKTLVLNARLDPITIKQNLGSPVYDEFMVRTKMPKMAFPTVRTQLEIPYSQWGPDIHLILSATFGSILGMAFLGVLAFFAFKVKKRKRKTGKVELGKKKRFVRKVVGNQDTECENDSKTESTSCDCKTNTSGAKEKKQGEIV